MWGNIWIYLWMRWVLVHWQNGLEHCTDTWTLHISQPTKEKQWTRSECRKSSLWNHHLERSQTTLECLKWIGTILFWQQSNFVNFQGNSKLVWINVFIHCARGQKASCRQRLELWTYQLVPLLVKLQNLNTWQDLLLVSVVYIEKWPIAKDVWITHVFPWGII